MIFNAWRNIVNGLKKGRIKTKYAFEFNNKFEQLQSDYGQELSRLNDVLSKIQLEIENEIQERRSLATFYDMAMNKGVEVFLKETNILAEFNSSG